MIFFKMINELELSNEEHFIECFDNLYREITSKYDFDYNRTETINVVRYAKQSINLFPCCCYEIDYIYTNYMSLQDAVYNLLYINNIQVNQEKDMYIEFIYARSRDEIIENGFAIHQDIDSKIKGDSYTIIIYLHTNCRGGELTFYQPTLFHFEKTFTIDPNTSLSSTTKVVIFNGEIFHKPEPFYNGERCAIVCQVSK